jgi:putative spermidine/putrescine transport system substrate-binding protein
MGVLGTKGTRGRKHSQALLLLLAAVVAALLVAGCGGSSSSSSESTGAETTSEESSGGESAASEEGSGGEGSTDLSGTTITYLGFGGKADETMEEAWFKPFEEETGAKIVLEAPTNYAKLQAQVQSGSVSYDLVDGDPFVMDPACGEEWEELKNVPNVSHVEAKYKPNSGCTVPDYIYSYIIGYSPEAFPKEHPETCEDFFNTEKFPGKRLVWSYYYGNAPDCAAVAAGADRNNPYPLETGPLLEEVKKIKGDITSFETGSQAAEAMANNDASMGIFTTRTIIEGEEVGADWKPAHGWSSTANGTFGIPKGAPNAEAAEQLINYILDPKNNVRFQELLPAYGSPEGATIPQAKEYDPYIVGGSPQLLKVGSVVDWGWWSENDAQFSEEWQSAITG